MKYWLVELVVDLEGGKVPQVVDGYDTIEEALNRFNKDLEGKFLGAPDLSSFPEAYIIKGDKISIEIKKMGVLSNEH